MPSRQRLWQLKQLAEGNCISCGKKRNHHVNRCDECAARQNAGQARRRARLVALGLCARCGRPRELLARFCNKCQNKINATVRRRYAKAKLKKA